MLNEQYVMAELENFEITSYYEQILDEEKVKTAQYEVEYIEKVRSLNVNDSRTSKSPSLPVISDDGD